MSPPTEDKEVTADDVEKAAPLPSSCSYEDRVARRVQLTPSGDDWWFRDTDAAPPKTMTPNVNTDLSIETLAGWSVASAASLCRL